MYNVYGFNIIGILSAVLSTRILDIAEFKRGYINGLGIGLMLIGLAMLMRNFLALKNSKLFKKREIELTDERLINIQAKAMSISFKIVVITETVAATVLVFLNNTIGIYFSFMACLQLVIYCVANIIVSKKM